MRRTTLNLSMSILAIAGVARGDDGATFVNDSKAPCILTFLPPIRDSYNCQAFLAEVRGPGAEPKTYAVTKAEFAGIKSSFVEYPYGVIQGFPYLYGLTIPAKGQAHLQPATATTYSLYFNVITADGYACANETQSCTFSPTQGASWYNYDHANLSGLKHRLTRPNAQTLRLTDWAGDDKAAPAAGAGAAAAAVKK